ncbi:hypothetical protein AOLI_G00305440 [Acnodon oligacanthus]
MSLLRQPAGCKNQQAESADRWSAELQADAVHLVQVVQLSSTTRLRMGIFFWNGLQDNKYHSSGYYRPPDAQGQHFNLEVAAQGMDNVRIQNMESGHCALQSVKESSAKSTSLLGL